uniref:ATP synthase F0 subunit 8 n=1 Tax=Loxoblemmus equestris TaxID=223239 RepID=A0A1B1SHP1_9ORTH|nr:ATP synthase F0 subunit 8 [Loxoblemmus equestris]
MPQMAPMSWLSLLIFSLLNSLIMMIMMNYFLTQPSFTIQNKIMLKVYTHNWKW